MQSLDFSVASFLGVPSTQAKKFVLPNRRGQEQISVQDTLLSLAILSSTHAAWNSFKHRNTPIGGMRFSRSFPSHDEAIHATTMYRILSHLSSAKCLSLAPNLTSSLTFAPKSNSQYSDNSLPSSDHGWLGTSTWPNPTQIKDDCVFRDEERLVREWTEHISEPPTKVLPYLQMGHFPETMRTYDTFTSQSPLLLQSFSSSEDSTTM